MNKDIEDKLNWLMDQGVDPKRSQIHTSVCYSPFHKVLYQVFLFDRYKTIYYDDLASWIYNLIYDLSEEEWSEHKEDLEEAVNAIYEDAKNHNMWGIVYDW